jgi:hypothetical protein
MEIFNESMIMLFNYHMILFTDFCYDNKVQYLVGGSYQASILLLVFVNISMIVTKVVESYKRKKHLDRLKDQYVLRMQEYREEKRQLALKIKEDRQKSVAQWKHRRYVRAFLQEKMKVDEEEQPISAPFRLQKQIQDGYKKRQIIVNARQVRAQNIAKLKTMKATNAKQKMFQDQLAVIFEESNHSLEEIEDEIKELEKQRDADLEEDSELRAMREIAEKNIEAELQEMKKNYIPRTPTKASDYEQTKTLAEQLAEEVEEPAQENFLVNIDDAEFDTAKKSVLSDMPFNPQDIPVDSPIKARAPAQKRKGRD